MKSKRLSVGLLRPIWHNGVSMFWRTARPGQSRRPRKVARRIPVKGQRDDKGRYFRCWNCGFVCDAQRDQLGGPEDRSGVSHSNFIVADNLGYQFGDSELDAQISLEAIGLHFESVSVSQSNGDPQPSRQDIKPDIGGGCPLCGTLNWRGDYP